MKPRILRNQADGSPGGGTPPPASAAPAGQPAPQASGAAPALDTAQVEALAAALLPKLKDGVFAEARRAGLLGKKPASGEGTAEAPRPTSTTVNFRPLDRAIATSGRQLNEAAYNRIEKAFAEEQPENATSWLADYFGGLGAPAPAAPATTQQQSAATTGNTPPVTQRGTPPAPQVPIEERPIMSMSDEDRQHFIDTKGVRAYVEKLNREKKAIGRVSLK